MNLKPISNFHIILLNKKNIALTFFIIYSIYNSLIIGTSWDEPFHLEQGRAVFNYLFSFGELNNYVHYREFYSASYWTIAYFITQFFPSDFSIQIFHLINLLIGWLTLFGFYKLGKTLFNKKIATLFFIILFFHPIFFGHMSMNGKDAVLTLSHVWIFYFFIEYLKKQNKKLDTRKIIFKVAILLALASGIQLYFIATLIPVFIFGLIDIFFLKKIINLNFDYKKLIKDIFFIILIFYITMIVFWIDAHNNILKSPLDLFLNSFDTDRGWKTNMLNGNIYLSIATPLNYVLSLTIHKSPEYLLFLYIFFILFYFKIKKFFYPSIKFLNYKLILILSILFFPTIILMLVPFNIYDGLRLFLWYIPYTTIIPALALFYFFENYKILINKIVLLFTLVAFIFYIVIFFGYTPFQYTYLNILSGKSSEKNTQFVNDYWGVSFNELIEKINKSKFSNNKKISVYLCGFNNRIAKKYIKSKAAYINFESKINSDYIILNNRTFLTEEKNKIELKNCYSYLGKKIISVTRMGHELSVFGTLKRK